MYHRFFSTVLPKIGSQLARVGAGEEWSGVGTLASPWWEHATLAWATQASLRDYDLRDYELRFLVEPVSAGNEG